jgi:hypothetical protein
MPGTENAEAMGGGTSIEEFYQDTPFKHRKY